MKKMAVNLTILSVKQINYFLIWIVAIYRSREDDGIPTAVRRGRQFSSDAWEILNHDLGYSSSVRLNQHNTKIEVTIHWFEVTLSYVFFFVLFCSRCLARTRCGIVVKGYHQESFMVMKSHQLRNISSITGDECSGARLYKWCQTKQ